MKREDVVARIRKEIEILANKPLEDMDKNIFFKNTYLDSMNMLNIVVFIEQEFNIELEEFFVDREKVSTLNKIADYVMEKAQDADS